MKGAYSFPIISALGACSILLSACASSQEPFVGNPNVHVAGVTPTQLAGRSVMKCVQNGGRLVERSDYHTVCAKPMDGSFGSLMYRALLTERYASNPEVSVQTSWAPEANGVRVSATAWIEHQNAFGKTTRNYIEAPDMKRQMQAGLEAMKAKLESQSVAQH
jgi:hypothetical protein